MKKPVEILFSAGFFLTDEFVPDLVTYKLQKQTKKIL